MKTKSLMIVDLLILMFYLKYDPISLYKSKQQLIDLLSIHVLLLFLCNEVIDQFETRLVEIFFRLKQAKY